MLLVYGECPFPANTGPRHHSIGLIRAAAQVADGDLVGLFRDEAERKRWIDLQDAIPEIRVRKLIPRGSLIARARSAGSAILRQLPPAIRDVESAALRRYLTQHSDAYDIVHLDQFKFVDYWKILKSTPSVMVPHDAYSLACVRGLADFRGIRARWRLRWLLFAFLRVEQNEYPHFTAVCPVSAVDAAWLKAISPECTVQTVGVPLDDMIRRVSAAQHPKTVICAGNFVAEPISRRAEEFVSDGWPEVRRKCASATLTVLGRKASRGLRSAVARASGARYVEWVDDYWELLRNAAAYVYPQAHCSGLQTKVQDAMAVGIPVVARAMTLAPLGAVDGVHAVIRNDPSEMGEAVAALMTNEHDWSAMSIAAKQLVWGRYGKEKITAQLADAYREALRRFQAIGRS